MARFIHEVMSTPVVTVGPNSDVKGVIRTMVARNIGSVVVVDGEEPIGIFTERDVVQQLSERHDLLELPVSAVMSSPLILCRPNLPIAEALHVMNSHKIRHLPVVQEGRLKGMVTMRDFANWAENVLTDRQHEVLLKALSLGYFEFPREVNHTALAKVLGMRPSTLTEILRATQKKITKHYLNRLSAGY